VRDYQIEDLAFENAEINGLRVKGTKGSLRCKICSDAGGAFDSRCEWTADTVSRLLVGTRSLFIREYRRRLFEDTLG